MCARPAEHVRRSGWRMKRVTVRHAFDCRYQIRRSRPLGDDAVCTDRPNSTFSVGVLTGSDQDQLRFICLCSTLANQVKAGALHQRQVGDDEIGPKTFSVQSGATSPAGSSSRHWTDNWSFLICRAPTRGLTHTLARRRRHAMPTPCRVAAGAHRQCLPIEHQDKSFSGIHSLPRGCDLSSSCSRMRLCSPRTVPKGRQESSSQIYEGTARAIEAAP